MNKDSESLLKEFSYNLSYHFSEVLNLPLAKPYWVFISLSHQCNLNCQMCGVKNVLKGKELDIDALKNALDEVAGWNSDCVVLFTGGEPFLREDAFGIIDYSVSLGLKTEIVSNGTMINNPHLVERIIDSGLKNIAISLDGATAQTHDSIRRVNGAYKKATDALRYLAEQKKIKGRGPEISAWVTIMNENVNELHDIIFLAKELGVECLVYHPVIVVQEDMQNTINNSKFWISQDKINILKEQIDKIADYRNKHGLVAFLHDPYLWINYFRGTLTREDWRCNPFVFIDIGPDGAVRSCGPVFGNIKDMGLGACLNTKDARIARERMSRCQRPCLQTCWARPEADSLSKIINNFTDRVDGLEISLKEKSVLLKEGFSALSYYEDIMLSESNHK